MERKKRSKSSGWECCYANKIFVTFGVEMRAYGQKLIKFCTHTDTHTHAAKLVVRIYYCYPNETTNIIAHQRLYNYHHLPFK